MIRFVFVTSLALIAILGRFKTANDITIAIAMWVVRISFLCLRWDLSCAALDIKLGSWDWLGGRLDVLFKTFIPLSIRLLRIISMAIGAMPVVVKGCNCWCEKKTDYVSKKLIKSLYVIFLNSVSLRSVSQIQNQKTCCYWPLFHVSSPITYFSTNSKYRMSRLIRTLTCSCVIWRLVLRTTQTHTVMNLKICQRNSRATGLYFDAQGLSNSAEP